MSFDVEYDDDFLPDFESGVDHERIVCAKGVDATRFPHENGRPECCCKRSYRTSKGPALLADALDAAERHLARAVALHSHPSVYQ